MKRDFLIIGQGLAGSLLAQSLIEHEQTVTVVDNSSQQSASRIAAGIINPLTGQRMVVAPDARQCLPIAIESYVQLAKQFNQTFYIPKSMLRLFGDVSDKDRYHSRKSDEDYKDFLGEEFSAGETGEPVNDPLGGFRQNHTGYLNIVLLLDCLKAHFKQLATYVESTIDYSEINLSDEYVEWKGHRFDHVVFCEGANVANNSWFRWLPFQLSKGELITINSKHRLPGSIVNKGHWLLPLDQHRAKIGASYAWDWSDERPTSDAEQELMRSAENLLASSESLSVTNHQSGIRPTTKDKNPFIGTHPQFSHVHCFTGFGSRGGILIPYYANCMVSYLLAKKPLPPTVDISRFQGTESLVVYARRYLSENITAGDVAIDATVGNGHDTELLARCVAENGHVYGFDVQEQAIINSDRRLLRSGLSDNVSLINGDHANMMRHITGDTIGKVSAIVFNLGFLPGSDKNCTTSAETTHKALENAKRLLKPRGFILVMTYSGHACGKKETETVKQWINNLNKTIFQCRMIDAKQKKEAPSLFIITKLKK